MTRAHGHDKHMRNEARHGSPAGGVRAVRVVDTATEGVQPAHEWFGGQAGVETRPCSAATASGSYCVRSMSSAVRMRITLPSRTARTCSSSVLRDEPSILHEIAAVTRRGTRTPVSAPDYQRIGGGARASSSADACCQPQAAHADNPSWQAPFESLASLPGEGREQSIRVRVVTCRAIQVHKRG